MLGGASSIDVRRWVGDDGVMRWPVFAFLAFLLLVLQEGLGTLWSVGGHSPSLLMVLMVFVSLWAPSLTGAYAALALGLLTDLSQPVYPAGQATDVALIGPACLGYLTGAYVTQQLRGMVFRHSPLVIGVMVLIAGAFVHLVVLAILTARGLPWLAAQPVAGWHAADQLVARFFDLLYTAGVGVVLGAVLVRFHWALGFGQQQGKAAYSWK